MPRKEITQAPVTTARRHLQDLLELVGRTPGWDVEPNPHVGGWRVTGGTKPLTVPSNLDYDEIDDLEDSLGRLGWSRQAAQEHIASLTALYGDEASAGYPKKDQVVTRAEAKTWLEFTELCGCNTRPLRPRKVKEYSEAMDRGEWQPYSPQGLVFSAEHGCLLDGRQRLTGLLKSGLAQMGFSITYDVPIAMFKYLDQGASRSVSDVLAGDGLPPGVRSKVGPAVKLALGYDSGLPWKKWRDLTITPAQISAALAGGYAEMPGKPYNDAITMGWKAKDSTGCKMLPAVAGALSFLIRREHPEPWEEFRTALVYGTNLSLGDPRLALRNQMVNRDTKKPRRYEPYMQMGAALIAWELWLNDLPADQITFKDNMEIPRIWVPGMPLSGKDANYKARQRVKRFEEKKATARESLLWEEGEG